MVEAVLVLLTVVAIFVSAIFMLGEAERALLKSRKRGKK